MAVKPVRIMGVHGLGDQRQSGWAAKWEAAIVGIATQVEGLDPVFEPVSYDPIFENTRLSIPEMIRAVGKLAISGVLGQRGERGFFSNASNKVRWSAGYVVAWVEDKEFQAQTRKLVLDRVRELRPDVILAHSLGSLVTYNAFSHEDAQEAEVAAILKKARYVTLGSQINNPFVVRNLTNGRVMPLAVRFWTHLYNRHDDVFTAPITLQGADNFRQVETPFDKQDDHSAETYLTEPPTVDNLWLPIAAEASGARAFTAVGPTKAMAKARAPRRKALLIGINDYPEESQRLEGCVNDVFTMSAVLQQCGFDPEDIRVCLNERADTKGILSRLEWLLEEAAAGDDLIFYYSGHGARIPEYGEADQPDRFVEALVPWDFDWTPERWVSDGQLSFLYSQLPNDCRFMMILDCCHSGGLARDGGPRPRGITPPDDIRHRELKWDIATEMWVQRDFARINEDFAPKDQAETTEKFFGKQGATYRLGRSGMLRGLSSREYQMLKKQDPEMARGAYLPVIIEACREDEFSYEYRHGATSYGAFTFCLAHILRREKTITFDALVAQVAKRLKDLKFAQNPDILGPGAVVHSKVPFVAGG